MPSLTPPLITLMVDRLLAQQPPLSAPRIARLAGCGASYVYTRKKALASLQHREDAA